MAVPAPPNELQEVAPISPQIEIRPKGKHGKVTTVGDIPDGVRIDENKNSRAEPSDTRKKGQFSAARQPIHHKVIRHSQHPHNFANDNQPHPPNPDRPVSLEYALPCLNSADEERFRICVVLITSWAFLIISVIFFVCYGYNLEWSPETADPIHIFSLDFGVNMLYIMFIIDIFASIGIILSYKGHVRPFRLRVYWPAVIFLILNQIHGTLIWLWVWTGGFPRTCSRNSFYFGRRCENLGLLMTINPDGKLKLDDCKCDYGSCLPECKGLRLIQNYFWGTYWLYVCRLAVLIIFIPRLNEIICQCKWCCCPDPRDLPVVGPEPTPRPETSGYKDVNSQWSPDDESTLDGDTIASPQSHIQYRDQSVPDHGPDHTTQHCPHEHPQPYCQPECCKNDQSKEPPPPLLHQEKTDVITREDDQCPVSCTYKRVKVIDKENPGEFRDATMICCHTNHPKTPDRDPHHEQQYVANCLLRASSSVSPRDDVKEMKTVKLIEV